MKTKMEVGTGSKVHVILMISILESRKPRPWRNLLKFDFKLELTQVHTYNKFKPWSGRFIFIFCWVIPHHQGILKLDCYIWYLSFPLIKLVLQTLNLTCTVWGDPTPEISWLKNEKSFASDDHCNLKFEAGKTAYFTITGVTTSDSGKYGLVVKNKYGSETSDFTISVFIPEEEARVASAKPQKSNKQSKWSQTAWRAVRRAALGCPVLPVCKRCGSNVRRLRAFYSLFLCQVGEEKDCWIFYSYKKKSTN